MPGASQLINGFLHHLGLELRRVSKLRAQGFYENLYPWASYAPWRKNSEFLATYNTIKANTLVDLYRCWELWDLAMQCVKLKGDLLEVGVWRGGTAGILGKCATKIGGSRTIFLADTFTGVPKASAKDRNYAGGEHSETSEEIVVTLLRDGLGLSNFKILKGIFPEETGHLAGSGPFCLCHVDVDVYRSAKDVMDWLWPKMCVGGMVVFDDYGFESTSGITEYVDEVREIADRLTFYNLNGHAVFIKLNQSCFSSF